MISNENIKPALKTINRRPRLQRQPTGFHVCHQEFKIHTQEAPEFIDITERVNTVVRNSRIKNGIINIQTKHTTAAIVINENEPLLLHDLKVFLEKIAPENGHYLHNDLSIRTVNLQPEEDENGHAHCRALFLRTSEAVNILHGDLALGRWQRIFLLELDKPRSRTISIAVLGSR